MPPLQMHREIVDQVTNFSLRLDWLDAQVPFEQLLSWTAIAIIGYIAWHMARFVVKHL